MRISARQDDPGYGTYTRARRLADIVVRVDGVIVKDCFTADTKRGYATVADRAENGALQLNGKKNGVKMKQLNGRVEVEFERRTH